MRLDFSVSTPHAQSNDVAAQNAPTTYLQIGLQRTVRILQRKIAQSYVLSPKMSLPASRTTLPQRFPRHQQLRRRRCGDRRWFLAADSSNPDRAYELCDSFFREIESAQSAF